MSKINIDEIDQALGTPVYNHLYKFIYDNNIHIEIFMYKINNKRKSTYPLLVSTVYSNSREIANINYNTKSDIYTLTIVENIVDNYKVVNVVENMKIYLDKICHEVADNFFYDVIVGNN